MEQKKFQSRMASLEAIRQAIAAVAAAAGVPSP
jgi:hypothetical protein